jgi:hypothetical protein
MSDASSSDTPLRATFGIRLNGGPVTIGTVGQAYRFINSISAIEWMEFRGLHDGAKATLEAAAENGIMTVQATDALRALFVRARLL